MVGTLTFGCLFVLYGLGQERKDFMTCDSGVCSGHACGDGEYFLVKLVAFSSNEDCLLTFLSYIGGKDC